MRERADTVIWLDVERSAVMRQLIMRTIRRVLWRESLWNGNRESLRDVLSRDPERSVIVWSWTRYAETRARYAAQIDTRWVRLTDRAEVSRFLAGASGEPKRLA